MRYLWIVALFLLASCTENKPTPSDATDTIGQDVEAVGEIASDATPEIVPEVVEETTPETTSTDVPAEIVPDAVEDVPAEIVPDAVEPDAIPIDAPADAPID